MIPKPSQLDRATAAYEKKLAKATEKRRSAKQRLTDWLRTSAKVRERDGERCRVCRRPTKRIGPPSMIGAAHHLAYRSLTDRQTHMDVSRIVWLCGQCHDDEHQHRIRITGTSDDLRIER